MYSVTSAEEKKLFAEQLDSLDKRLSLLGYNDELEDSQVKHAWGFSVWRNENETLRYALA